MKLCFPQLKRTSYGKQVMAIEKLLYGISGPESAVSSTSQGEAMMTGSRGGGGPDEHSLLGVQSTRQGQMQAALPMNGLY